MKEQTRWNGYMPNFLYYSFVCLSLLSHLSTYSRADAYTPGPSILVVCLCSSYVLNHTQSVIDRCYYCHGWFPIFAEDSSICLVHTWQEFKGIWEIRIYGIMWEILPILPVIASLVSSLRSDWRPARAESTHESEQNQSPRLMLCRKDLGSSIDSS